MADINITVDSSQVKSTKQELLELGNSFNSASKSASIFAQAFARAAKQSQRDEQYIKATSLALRNLINDNMKITNAYKSAEQSASAFTQELRKQEAQAVKTARANQDAFNRQLGVDAPSAVSQGAGSSAIEGELDRLATKYDRVYNATKLYESQLADLTRAHQFGIISIGKYQMEVQNLQTEFNQFTAAQDNATLSGNRFSQHVNQTGRGLNNFGMYAQQVGYQVGDFFVQMQSGTSVFVAFGQQATQLAGLLPGLAGAIVGIGISVTTAFLAFNERAMQAKDSVNTFRDALDNLKSSTQSLKVELESLTLGVTPEQAALILEAKKLESERRDILVDIAAQTAELTNSYNASEQDIRGVLFAEYDRLKVIEELLAAKEKELKANEELVGEVEKAKEQSTLVHDLIVKISNVDLSQPFASAMPAAQTFLDKLREMASAYATYGPGNVIPGTATPYGEFREDGMSSAARGVMRDRPNPFGTVSSGAAGPASISGGGGGGSEPSESMLEKLQKQLDIEKELLGTTETYQRVRSALGDEFINTSPMIVEGLMQQATEIENLTRLEEERRSLMDSVNGTLEGGFMAMVKGTQTVGEAFKSMAAAILEELFRVLVVQKLVAGFTGSPGGVGIGGLFGGGKRASGGSMMSGQPYLVGEQGPELVIPRHSGTVVNANQTAGAMAGSGGFTQNLSINVTGSDAAMVRQEVAKMIPQITSATKAAVIDAKQRGGQMAAAFR